jgi:hypothetical protein
MSKSVWRKAAGIVDGEQCPGCSKPATCCHAIRYLGRPERQPYWEADEAAFAALFGPAYYITRNWWRPPPKDRTARVLALLLMDCILEKDEQ